MLVAGVIVAALNFVFAGLHHSLEKVSFYLLMSSVCLISIAILLSGLLSAVIGQEPTPLMRIRLSVGTVLSGLEIFSSCQSLVLLVWPLFIRFESGRLVSLYVEKGLDTGVSLSQIQDKQAILEEDIW